MEYTKDQWVEMMRLGDKVNYLVGFPKGVGFTPVKEEVLFLTPEPKPWIEDFLARRAGEIDAMFRELKYRFCYLPDMVRGMDAERLEYNSPGADAGLLTGVDVKQRVHEIYRRLFDMALTPIPEKPMLIRYKWVPSEINEQITAAKQGRETNLVFSYRVLPETEDEGVMMDFFREYIENTGDESVYFSLAKPETEQDTADFYFAERVTALEEEIRTRVEELRKLGVAELVISNLLQAPKPEPSRLTITKDFRLFLTDYGNREVKMTVLPKTLYFFYLNHPEGVLFKELVDYEQELMEYYKLASNRINLLKMYTSIKDLVDPTKNSINEKASLVRSAFVREFDVEVVKDYIISSDKDRRKRILIDRKLVVDESGRILKGER